MSQQQINGDLSGRTTYYKVDIKFTERFFKEIVDMLIPFIMKHVMKQALHSNKLVMGIGDFAIRKGHRYNTGINDLKGEIVNYHRCSFTNGIVEGGNGKINSLQRQRFICQTAATMKPIEADCQPHFWY